MTESQRLSISTPCVHHIPADISLGLFLPTNRVLVVDFSSPEFGEDVGRKGKRLLHFSSVLP